MVEALFRRYTRAVRAAALVYVVTCVCVLLQRGVVEALFCCYAPRGVY